MSLYKVYVLRENGKYANRAPELGSECVVLGDVISVKEELQVEVLAYDKIGKLLWWDYADFGETLLGLAEAYDIWTVDSRFENIADWMESKSARR